MQVILTEEEFLSLKDKANKVDLVFKDNVELTRKNKTLEVDLDYATNRRRILNEQLCKICRYTFEEIFKRKMIFCLGDNGSVSLIDNETNKTIKIIEYKEPIPED